MRVPLQAKPVQRNKSSARVDRVQDGVKPSSHWYCSLLGPLCSGVGLPSPVCNAVVGCCNNI